MTTTTDDQDEMETPFQFGLQRVRDLRAHDEDAAKEQFAASLSQRLRGEAMLRAVEEQLRSARVGGQLRSGAGALSGAALVSRQAWVERLERSRSAAEVTLNGMDADLAARRRALAAASLRREVLDRLKARQGEAHRRASERREGAQLDEMALTVHARRASA